MKHFLLLLSFTMLCTAALQAQLIQNDRLKVHAALLPKTVLMDYQFQEKLVDNKIVIGIFYQSHLQNKAADALKEMLILKYPEGINGYALDIQLIRYDKLDAAKERLTFYYLFPAEDETIRSVLKKAAKDNAMTFTYNYEDLRLGAMMSVRIAKQVKPVINIDAIKNENISLRPLLLQIAEIYYQTRQKINGFYDQLSLSYV